MLADYRNHGLADTSAQILDHLRGAGLPGATILELGCGVGALCDELVTSGAASAKGIDLSKQMIEGARALSSSLGLSHSTSFDVGDGATDYLTRSDYVILDAVFCCYPDASALLHNSAMAAVRSYVISIPDDRRPIIKVLKHLLPLQGLFQRRGSFRFYVHPVRSLVHSLEEAGFRLVSDSKVGWFWAVLAFERVHPLPASQ